MRLLAIVAMMLLIFSAPALVASAEDSKGCTIDLSDPTDPGLYGDCLVVGGDGIIDTRSTEATATLFVPEVPDCQELCASYLRAHIDADASLTSPNDGEDDPLLTVSLEHEASVDDETLTRGEFFASTLSPPSFA